MLVFHNNKGNFLHDSNIRQRFWKKLPEISGYPPDYARIHDLRGTNSDIATTVGLPISFAQDQLGYASATTTLKNYSKSNNSMRQNGIIKFEEVFQKCENFVRTEEKNKPDSIIYFPQKAKRE